ncbi:MAG: phasin family protein [Rhizobiales bacterium]|nr:phasin family protein [Hyphomicrobiales bacterium]
MFQSFDDVSKYSKEFIDSGLKSFASVSKGAQALAAETTDYSKKSFEAGSQAFEKLLSAKSVDKAIEVQTQYAKEAYESFVAGATRLGEIYADMAKEAYKPYEAIVAKAK